MGHSAQTYQPEVMELLSRLVLSVRFRTSLANLPGRVGQAYDGISGSLREQAVSPACASFVAYYIDVQDLDIEASVPVNRELAGKGDIQRCGLSACRAVWPAWGPMSA